MFFSPTYFLETGGSIGFLARIGVVRFVPFAHAGKCIMAGCPTFNVLRTDQGGQVGPTLGLLVRLFISFQLML